VSDIESEIAEEMGEELEAPTDGNQEGESEGDAEQADAHAGIVAPAPRSQKEIDAVQDKLAKEAERHARRVEEIMGDDFGFLVPNPTDWTPGFIFNIPEMHPQPEQVAELHALLGQSAPLELREAEDAEGCDKCNALGEVLTGSRKPGQETKPCSACSGTGWRTKLREVASVASLTNPVMPNGGAIPSPETYQVKDSWGRPSGHPHFGIDPVAITA